MSSRLPPGPRLAPVLAVALAGLIGSAAAAAAGTAVLTGTVVDASSGEPLPRVEVRVENRAADAFNWTYTARDGTYRIEVPAGDLLVGFHPNRTVPPSCQDTPAEMGRSMHACDTVVYDHAYAPDLRSVHAGPGSHTLHAKLPRLEQNGTGIQGWVVDARTGEPLGNATVVLHDLSPDRWATATTDANGAWAFQLEEGPVTVRALAEGYAVSASTETVRSPPTETILRASPGDADREPVGHGFAPSPPENDSRWADLAAPTDGMGPPPTFSDASTRASPNLGLASSIVLSAIAAFAVRRRGG